MRDYFTYLPLAEETLLWGAGVTSTGFLRSASGTVYPTKNLGHPPDHLFTWKRGRVLDSWQIVHLHEGRGEFESKSAGRRRVEKGGTFILFPGEWHRYRPDRTTGWSESWVEFEGAVPEHLKERGLLAPSNAVFSGGEPVRINEVLAGIHSLAKARPSGFAAHLATSALQLLALLVQQDGTAVIPDSPAQIVVNRARDILEKVSEEPVCIAALSRKLGVAQSHFRRIFKAHTGVSPKQYSRAIRHRRVRALLRGSALSVAEIAIRTGYHSAFHLSSEFKKETGLAPSLWRRFQHQEHQYSGESRQA